MDYVWLKVSSDKYELPMAVADSCQELADILGISTNSIYSAISHLEHGKRKHCCYKRVKFKKGELDD